MTKGGFVHLHVHTEFSMLDGKAKIPDYVARAKKLGMPALAITDHGNMGGTYEFYKECKDAGIDPILGEEFYFVPNAAKVKDEKEGERFHVVFLARNEAGFRTLVELSTESHKRYYYKPLLDRALLEGLSERDRRNLVVLSGCAGSIISRKAVGEVEGSVSAEVRWWARTFPNFYMELQHHDTDFDKRLNLRLLKFARKFELPWVVTNDPHYVTKDECTAHDALLAIQTASDLDDPNRFRFEGGGYHLRSDREMERAFKRYGSDVYRPGANETLRIAKACRTRIKAWDSKSWHIPRCPGVADADRELRKLAKRGLRDLGLQDDPRYVERMEHELERFASVPGMADFLLIDRRAIEYAKSVGIRVGPGRGSVCGTLVGYLIGLHKIDSVRYDLLFERFLNPERPKMPDIDHDFQGTRRGEMIEYAVAEYGEENTQRVGAFQTMKIKKAFGNLARAHGIDFKARIALAKKIEEDADGNAVLPAEIMEGYPDLHTLLEALTGLKSGLSRHPAGVLILDPEDKIRKYLPMQWIPNSKAFVSQFDLDTAGALGLSKNDYLALRTLDTIEECVRLIRERHGIDIEPDDWVPDEEGEDEQVYKMLADGHVIGVFQMEGGTNRRGIQAMECMCFEDIVACTSLYRKGPLDDKADKRYLRNKKEGEARVAHKKLRSILGKTWGEMIYQEQMFSMLHDLAGFSWSRVDDAKTAMVKKDPEKMAALKDEAIEGFRKVSKMKPATAEKVWDKIQACAGYLFNRSHAVAYSMLTYQTARLKYLYPLEYMAALLRTVDPDSKEKKEKRAEYMGEAIRMGFRILPPDVNLSDLGFTPIGDDQLLFGLQDIKDVGPSAVAKLLNHRNKKRQRFEQRGLDTTKVFNSVTEVDILVNKKVMAALANSGALASLGIKPDHELQESLLSWQFHDPIKRFRKKLSKKVVLPGTGRGSHVVLAGHIVRSEKRETKTGKTYYSWLLRWKPGEEFRITLWDSASSLFKLRAGSVVILQGKWNDQFSNVSIGDPSDVRVIFEAPKKTKEDAA